MTIPLRVLMLEDNPSDAELILHELQRAGYDPQFEPVDSEAGFLTGLDALPDLILADYRLPQFDGLRALQRVQERQLDIPFIIVSGTIGEDIAVESMKHGVVDYLLKDRLARLGQAVAQALEQKRLRAENRLADAALRESELRYRTITENMSDTVWLMDLGFQTTWISPSVTRTRGYTLEELQSLPLDKQLTPDSLQRMQSLIISELTPERLADKNCEISASDEFEFYRKDGSIFWGDIVVTLLRDADGKPSGFLGAGRDITERKQAEARLTQEQSLLQILMDNIPDPIYFKDKESRFIRINRAQAVRFGLTDPAQALGKTDFDFFAEEHARPAYEDEQSIIQTGIPIVNLEEREVWPDRPEAWVLTTKMPLRDREGGIIGTFGISRDITRRKQAEESLRIAEEKYRLIFENSVEGIYQSTLQGRFVTANPALVHMLGYSSPEELIEGASDLNRLFYIDPTRRQEFIRLLEEQETITGFESQIYRKDGSAVWVSENARAVRDENGNLLYYEGTVLDITKRKKAEAEVIEAHDRLAATMDAIPELLFDVDRFGCIYEYRSPISESLYVSPEMFLGKRVMEVLPEPAASIIQGAIDEAAVQGRHRGASYALDLPDGQKWFELSISTKGEIGSPEAHFIVLARDITERKQAELALQESELALAEAQNVAHVGSWQYDVATGKSIWSKEMFRIFARDPSLGEPSWQEYWASIHPDDSEKVDSGLQAAIERGILNSLEFRLVRPDQSVIWGWTIGKVVQDSQGKVVKLYGTVQDITERKQAELALRESEEKYRLSFENVSDVIYMLDTDFRIISVSPSVERLLSYKVEELVNRSFPDLNILAPESLEKAASDALRVFSGEQIEGSLYEFMNKDGKRLFGEVSGSPLYRNGKIVGLISVARDITERVHAEEKIKASLTEKEALLKEVHHRVKNNLAIVSSLLEMQARRSQDEQVRNEFKVSQQRILAMAQIHEQLYRSQNLAEIDMADYVTALTNGLLAMDLLSDVVMKVEIREVILDIDQAVPCGLIINELLTNALKYAFSTRRRAGDLANGQRKEILVSMQPENECYVLKISDNGAGLPDGLDVKNTRTLGLKLVNRLTGQLEGDLQVDSKPGGGTAITISFPVSGGM
jgi:PAS domain S-box-containing protein